MQCDECRFWTPAIGLTLGLCRRNVKPFQFPQNASSTCCSEFQSKASVMLYGDSALKRLENVIRLGEREDCAKIAENYPPCDVCLGIVEAIRNR